MDKHVTKQSYCKVDFAQSNFQWTFWISFWSPAINSFSITSHSALWSSTVAAIQRLHNAGCFVISTHPSRQACLPASKHQRLRGRWEEANAKKQKAQLRDRSMLPEPALYLRVMGMSPPLTSLLVCWDHIAILDPNQALPSSSKQGLGPRPSVCPLETFVKKSTFIRNVIWYTLPISAFFLNPGIMEPSVDNCNNLYIQYLSNLMSKRENKVRAWIKVTWDLH